MLPRGTRFVLTAALAVAGHGLAEAAYPVAWPSTLHANNATATSSLLHMAASNFPAGPLGRLGQRLRIQHRNGDAVGH